MADRDRPIVGGLILIGVGLTFLALQHIKGLGWEVVLLLLGAAFLVGYVWRREYGLLVPAGILLGLGGGFLAEDYGAGGEPILLGLGIGFIGIYVVGLLLREPRAHWWPLIPGGVLVALSLDAFKRVFRFMTDNWPLVLVAIGVLMVLSGLRGRGRRARE